MSTTADHLSWFLEDTRGRTLKLLDDVSQEEFTWRPCPSCNSIASMGIHIGRVEDVLGSRALGLDGQLWKQDGWGEKLGLGEDDWGWGFDAQAPSVQKAPGDVGDYLRALQERSLPALRSMSPNRLDEEVPGRNPRTVGEWLAFIASEELQHLGQMDYVRGMKRAGG